MNYHAKYAKDQFVKRLLSGHRTKDTHTLSRFLYLVLSSELEELGMYSLTIRVRVITPPQHGRNGTAHAVGASISSRRGESVFAGMRSAWHCVQRVVGLADYRWALPCISIVLP